MSDTADQTVVETPEGAGMDKAASRTRRAGYDDEGKPTQHQRWMEYPVLTGMFIWLNARWRTAGRRSRAPGWLPYP